MRGGAAAAAGDEKRQERPPPPAGKRWDAAGGGGAAVVFARAGKARRVLDGSDVFRLVAATTMAAHARDKGEVVSENGAVDDLRTEAIRELREETRR